MSLFEKPKRVQPTREDTREEQVMRVIEEWFARYGYAPTYKEIRIRCEFVSDEQVKRAVVKLIEDGYLKRVGGMRRVLRLTGKRMFQ